MNTLIINQKYIRIISLVVGISLSAILAFYLIRHARNLEDFISQLGIIGVLVSIGLQTIFGASPIPTEPLTLINGAVFGPFRGAAISWTGYMFASYIEYFIGVNIGDTTEFDDNREKLPFGLGRLPVESPIFLMAGRIIPAYGPKMVGVMGGMYRVPLWRYTWTAAILNLFGALIFSFGGFGLKGIL